MGGYESTSLDRGFSTGFVGVGFAGRKIGGVIVDQTWLWTAVSRGVQRRLAVRLGRVWLM